jgi:exonuclease SbcC
MFFDEWSNTYVRNGSDYASVTVYLDNGTMLERRKGSINEIKIIYPGGEEKVFANFGIEAPPDVKKILNVYPAVIDSDHVININVADQDSPLFLLPDSAPTKTKFLNRLTGLHIVDAAIRDIRTERTYAINTKKNLVTSLERFNEGLTKYEKLDNISVSLNDTLIKMDTVNTNIVSYNKLSTAMIRLKDLDKKLYGVHRFITTYNKMKPVVDQIECKFAVAKRLFRLGYVFNKISSIQQDIITLITKETSLKTEYKICPVCLREW